jgi:imidazole glycerol-phosphate synthase subunit HisH
MIIIVDYGMGNLRSVAKAFHRIGEESMISSSAKDIENADKLILPGVGHFGKAVENLKQLRLWDVLNKTVLIKKKPVLGICLGMQLMAGHSEEGDADGLGWFDAEVVRFTVSDKLRFKVPHTGWNDAVVVKSSPLFKGISEDAMYYFVHAYHFKCNNKDDIVTTTVYDYPFTSSVQKDNIFGVQFHPEKSHKSGELLLRNFVDF